MKSRIPVSEISRRHPDMPVCRTDREYAALANDIYDILGDELSFMDDKEVRNLCVSLALYFEDIHSATRQFDAFTRLYGKMYGMYLPFYDSRDASSPGADLDAMKFVLWLSIVAERRGRIVNPANASIAEIADVLLAFWHSRRDSVAPNTDLADYLFSEETQADPFCIRSVMVWLQNRSYLGHWFSNAVEKGDHYNVRKLCRNADSRMVRELTEDCSAFEYPSWPLSIPAAKAYAEMIRIDMDDPDDEIAADIEKMEYAGLQIYKILYADNEHLAAEDAMKRRYDVLLSSFGQDIRIDAKRETHIYGSFFSFRGAWHTNGHSLFFKMKAEKYAEYCKAENGKHSLFHDYEGQYDGLIERHGGRRLFFFSSPADVKTWLGEEVGIEHFENFPASAFPPGRPFMLFLHPNGQMLFSLGAECVNSPDNPYYHNGEAADHAMSLCLTPEGSHPDLAMYLIEHNLVPDAMFNDIKGREHGRTLLQENLDFMARCMRRDITTDKVVRRRTGDRPADGGKVNFETFVNILGCEKTILSKANKEWRVVRCNKTTTVVRDVRNRRDFSMPTSSLYEAYCELGKNDIQVAALARYVGKANASAASALLYNTVGKGKDTNQLRKAINAFLSIKGR